MFALGGRFLFGGSYFFVFSLGIYFYFHIDLLDRMAAKAAVIVISLMMLGYILFIKNGVSTGGQIRRA